ncbi:MAG: hypothetical protein AOA66_1619 [Candidatus Bathyarchaeota archaeon BA2]|nr:MAG: hypothetical protein AOA66_1619 [Candidatus Bathyarchaeota archaeon BA2]
MHADVFLSRIFKFHHFATTFGENEVTWNRKEAYNTCLVLESIAQTLNIVRRKTVELDRLTPEERGRYVPVVCFEGFLEWLCVLADKASRWKNE